MTKDLVTCPIENTLKLIKRKWTIVLIRDMFLGKKHFYEFKEKNSELSNTVLSDTLKSMEQDGLIEKTFFNQKSIYINMYRSNWDNICSFFYSSNF